MGTAAGVVRRPRHFLIYRFKPDLLVVGRLLHDAMELARHLDPETLWAWTPPTPTTAQYGRPLSGFKTQQRAAQLQRGRGWVQVKRQDQT